MKRSFSLLQELLIVWTLTPAAGAFAQTAFTYQGRLTDNGVPANGNYDLLFTLRDTLTAGNAVGSPYGVSPIGVTNGLFTATVDFGAGVFTGDARWLEISVRPNGFTGAYSTLAPRQPITSTPYAIQAANAATAATSSSANAVAAGVINSAALANGAVTSAKLAPGAVYELSTSSGSISNAVQVDTNGLVGIGTSAPQAGLQIVSGSSIVGPQLLSQARDEVAGYTNLDSASDVAVFGNLLAVAGFNDSGITLIDIANPQAPILRSQFRDGDGGFTNLRGAFAVAMKTNLLAVAAYADSAVTLVSVANPASPVKLAELRDGVGGWNELNTPYAVAISGNLLAIAAYGDNAVTLADISNPSAPVKRVEMKDGLFGFTNLAHASSVAINGNLLAIGAYGDNAVTLVNISDPANPIKLAELRDGVGGFNNLAGVYGVALSTNGLLAIAAYVDSAVTLVNVANPASPVKLAEWRDGINGVDSLQGALGVAFSGNWLAASGTGDNAVTLFDISNPASPTITAVVRDGIGGFNFLNAPYRIVFAGTNLAVPSFGGHSATVIGFPTASAGLLSQGWVGIGTTQPKAALDVRGDVVVENAALFDINANRVELGVGATASGYASTALGYSTTASGDYSTALGYATKASGDYSTALGIFTTASGYASTALGHSTTASGNYSTALEDSTTASGNYSTASGYGTTASGFISTALGNSTTANGDYSTALGYYTVATNYALAAGNQAKALHNGSFVWADNQFTDFTTTADNQFLIRASGGVGINTNNPNGAALNVNGVVLATGFSGSGANLNSLNATSLSSGTVADARLSANVALINASQAFSGANIFSSPLTASGGLRLSDGDVYLRSDANHGLGWYGTTKLFAGANVDGPVLYGFSGGALGSLSGGQKIALAWNSAQQVAIGTNTPNASLTIIPATGTRGLELKGNRTGDYSAAVAHLENLNTTASASPALRVQGNGDSIDGTLSVSANGTGRIARFGNATSWVAEITTNGNISANSFAGSGASLTSLNAANVSGTLSSQVSAAAGLRLNDTNLWLRSGSDADHGLGWYGGGRPFATNSAMDGPVLFGHGGGALGARVFGSEKIVLFWNSSGQVGIGTNNPQSALHVVGAVTATAFNQSSDRNLKENFASVSPPDVLNKVVALPISRWNFIGDAATPHVGPMAQDFHAAFELGTDDRHIATVDADGIALAAIQGLNQKLESKVKAKDAQIELLEKRLDTLEQWVKSLLARNSDGQLAR